MRKKVFRIVRNDWHSMDCIDPLLYRIEQRHTILCFLHWWSTPEFAPPHLFTTIDKAREYIREQCPKAKIIELLENPACDTMKKEWYDNVEAERRRVDCCVISGELDSFTIELWYAYDDGSKSPKVAYRFNDIGEMQQLAKYLIGLAKEAKQEG